MQSYDWSIMHTYILPASLKNPSNVLTPQILILQKSNSQYNFCQRSTTGFSPLSHTILNLPLNLLIDTVTYEIHISGHWVLIKFVRIRWLTRCIFKYSKWRECFSTKTVIMDCINIRWLHARFKSGFVFFLFTGNFIVSVVWWQLGSLVLKVMWSGELHDIYTAAVSVFCSNGRRNCRY